MALTYLGDCTAFKQISPPIWDKNYAGQPDTCSIVYQGPQVSEKAFITALTKFQTMQTVAGLTVIDERGNNVGDSHMFLIRATSDESAVMPKVTCYFEGCRNGTTPDAVPSDDITTQSASTNHVITDATSPNYQKSLTLTIQYKAARTSWEWCQLSDPAGTATYGTVRYPVSYSQPPSDPNIFPYRYSGMFDAAGDPSNTISTGDATAVWNSFSFGTIVSGFKSEEVIPGKLWKCNSTADSIITGT